MFADEVEDGEVAFGVAYDAGMIFQLQQADVAMMILQGLELEPGTIFGFQLKTFVAAVVSGNVLVKPRAVIIKERGMAEGSLAIRPPIRIHLQQAQIHSKLDLFLAVPGSEFPDDNLSRLVFPLGQEIRYVKIHAANMAGMGGQVNYASVKLVLDCALRSKWCMSSLARVAIHSSQFPENVRRDLLGSLDTRKVNHKFHYDSVKQTQQWLALHQAYSPSRTDADCGATYDRSFAAVAGRVAASRIHLIGLGCGGGQKDTRLLRLLRDSGKEVFYTPSDVSTAMVLTARQAALTVISEESCSPLVCDLASADDLSLVLDGLSFPGATRLITFFGMIPNFEPQIILPRLAALVGPADYLLLSANLAPGADYASGVGRMLPLYDNAMTREWLMSFLLDLGMEQADGELRFVIEEDAGGSALRRVAAYFQFLRPVTIHVDSRRFEFWAGETIRLFFSYRHTPALVRILLGQHGLQVVEQWTTNSEEEGVFLVSRR